MSAEVRVLEVRLGADLVGHLSRCGPVHRFAAAPTYAGRADRPTLSLSLLGATEAETRQRLTSDAGPHVLGIGRLPPFFRNLLPGPALRRRVFGAHAMGNDHDFDVLASAGADLPGAVSLEPAPFVPPPVLEWHERHTREPLVAVPASAPRPGAFSLAGANDKRLFVARGDEGHDDGHWFVKLGPLDVPPSAANEYGCTRLAAAAGVRTVESRLVEAGALGLAGLPPAERVLLVRRFDRSGVARIHAEDLAQVLERDPEDRYGRGENYETVALVLGELSAERVETILELVRRLVVDVLLGNGGRHLKNIAVLYPDGRTPLLAPSYDTASTVGFSGDDRLALPLAGEREMSRVTAATFSDFSRAVGLTSKAVDRCVRNTVRRALASWPALLAELPFDDPTRQRILERLATLPLATGHTSRAAA